MDEDMFETTEIDLSEVGPEIDLRDRLRFAAGSLAADFGDALTVDRAEELVFSSAEGLLAVASVTEFVPILAERRARRVVRSGAMNPQAAVPVPRPAVPVPRPAVPAPRPSVPAPRPAVPVPHPNVPSSWPGGPTSSGPPHAPSAAPLVTTPGPTPTATPPLRPPAPPVSVPTPALGDPGTAPLFAVPEGEMTRLRDEVERVRMRVADWSAELGRRSAHT